MCLGIKNYYPSTVFKSNNHRNRVQKYNILAYKRNFSFIILDNYTKMMSITDPIIFSYLIFIILTKWAFSRSTNLNFFLIIAVLFVSVRIYGWYELVGGHTDLVFKIQ
jgi:hypothetical protein